MSHYFLPFYDKCFPEEADCYLSRQYFCFYIIAVKGSISRTFWSKAQKSAVLFKAHVVWHLVEKFDAKSASSETWNLVKLNGCFCPVCHVPCKKCRWSWPNVVKMINRPERSSRPVFLLMTFSSDSS